MSPERLAVLERQWAALVAPFGGDPAATFRPFDTLVAAYREPHRHYHTLGHVADVLRVAGRLLPAGADPTAAFLAAWFHDAVYDPARGDNEARSADLAGDLLPAVSAPPGVVDEVRRLVLATDHRVPPPGDPAAVALVDADLAILGAAAVRYSQYSAGVRAEYAHVADADYRAGRRRVLEAFLARGAIFRHPLLLAEGEAAARANLAGELAGLAE